MQYSCPILHIKDWAVIKLSELTHYNDLKGIT